MQKSPSLRLKHPGVITQRNYCRLSICCVNFIRRILPMTCCMKAGDPGSVVLRGIISQPVTTPLLSRRRRSTIIAPDTKTPEWSSRLLFFLFPFSFFNKRHQGNVSDATRRGLANTPRGGGGGGLRGRSCYTDSVETTWRGTAPVRAVVASSALPSASWKTVAYNTWRMTAHLSFLLLLLYRVFQYLPQWDKFKAIFTSPKKTFPPLLALI